MLILASRGARLTQGLSTGLVQGFCIGPAEVPEGKQVDTAGNGEYFIPFQRKEMKSHLDAAGEGLGGAGRRMACGVQGLPLSKTLPLRGSPGDATVCCMPWDPRNTHTHTQSGERQALLSWVGLVAAPPVSGPPGRHTWTENKVCV